MPIPLDTLYDQAAAAIAQADALWIGAGAGMGVDSGLPDFRGNEGFWKAYPPFRGKRFAEMSNPIWFKADPEQAWGFFGHRLHLYRDTQPHAGFALLKNWAGRMSAGHFVFTTNVDGQFQKAGFVPEQVFECHGSIHFLQCSIWCQNNLWSTDSLQMEVDMETVRACSPLPRCPKCRTVARPNILMFGDYSWVSDRSDEQERRYRTWLQSVSGRRLVAVELGAGLGIPTLRIESEELPAQLIRINPREPETPPPGISIPVGALEALSQINRRLPSRWQ